MQVPVIPTDSTGLTEESGAPAVTMETSNAQLSEETRMAELLKVDDREGHEV